MIQCPAVWSNIFLYLDHCLVHDPSDGDVYHSWIRSCAHQHARPCHLAVFIVFHPVRVATVCCAIQLDLLLLVRETPTHPRCISFDMLPQLMCVFLSPTYGDSGLLLFITASAHPSLRETHPTRVVFNVERRITRGSPSGQTKRVAKDVQAVVGAGAQEVQTPFGNAMVDG